MPGNRAPRKRPAPDLPPAPIAQPARSPGRPPCGRATPRRRRSPACVGRCDSRRDAYPITDRNLWAANPSSNDHRRAARRPGSGRRRSHHRPFVLGPPRLCAEQAQRQAGQRAAETRVGRTSDCRIRHAVLGCAGAWRRRRAPCSRLHRSHPVRAWTHRARHRYGTRRAPKPGDAPGAGDGYAGPGWGESD